MNNQEKGTYLLEAISHLERSIDQGRFAEYPYRMSLRERIRLVLLGTRAECLTKDIQDKYVPTVGDFSPVPITVLAAAIKGSSEESLVKIFKAELLEHELGM
ncbi:hypothetical protein J3P85_19370 [Pseudomonas sp. Z1-12]|uniref:hypothetical protein n=1 Tax=Pseudomonas sp. Z1-12 TaxID=2817408 RepID=UPI003DA8BE18